MRKAFLAGVLSVGLLLAGVGLASPASAAPSLVDNGDGSITVSGLDGRGVFFCPVTVPPNGAMGSVPEPCNPDSSDYEYGSDGTYTAGSTVDRSGDPGSVGLPAGTYTISIFDGGSGTSTGLSPVTIGSGGGGTSSSSTSGSNPAPVIQQFGRPDTLTCLEGQPDGLNIGGVDSGGWGESWSQWMNDGTGGFVCTRTLTYSNTLGYWVVG